MLLHIFDTEISIAVLKSALIICLTSDKLHAFCALVTLHEKSSRSATYQSRFIADHADSALDLIGRAAQQEDAVVRIGRSITRQLHVAACHAVDLFDRLAT